MAGWFEEQYYSMHRLLLIAIEMKKPENEIAKRFFNVNRAYPDRAEPTFAIATYYWSKLTTDCFYSSVSVPCVKEDETVIIDMEIKKVKLLNKIIFLVEKSLHSVYPSHCTLFVDENVYLWNLKEIYIKACMVLGGVAHWKKALKIIYLIYHHNIFGRMEVNMCSSVSKEDEKKKMIEQVKQRKEEMYRKQMVCTLLLFLANNNITTTSVTTISTNTWNAFFQSTLWDIVNANLNVNEETRKKLERTMGKGGTFLFIQDTWNFNKRMKTEKENT